MSEYSLIHKLIFYYRDIMNRLGFREEERKYDICYIDMKHIANILNILQQNNYFYNDLSTRYRNQIYTVRYLVGHNFQIHLRIYNNGRVTGHYEIRTEHPSEHLLGFGYRPLDRAEAEKIHKILGEINEL